MASTVSEDTYGVSTVQVYIADNRKPYLANRAPSPMTGIKPPEPRVAMAGGINPGEQNLESQNPSRDQGRPFSYLPRFTRNYHNFMNVGPISGPKPSLPP